MDVKFRIVLNNEHDHVKLIRNVGEVGATLARAGTGIYDVLVVNAPPGYREALSKRIRG